MLAEVTEGPQERGRREGARRGGSRICRDCELRFRYCLKEQARSGLGRGLSRHRGGLGSRWSRGAGQEFFTRAGGGRTIRPSGVLVQDLGGGDLGAGSPEIDDCADGAGQPLCLRELKQQPQGERLRQMVSGALSAARDPLLHPHPRSAPSRMSALPPMDGCGRAADPGRTLQSLSPPGPSPGPLAVAPASLVRSLDGSDVRTVSY